MLNTDIDDYVKPNFGILLSRRTLYPSGISVLNENSLFMKCIIMKSNNSKANVMYDDNITNVVH